MPETLMGMGMERTIPGWVQATRIGQSWITTSSVVSQTGKRMWGNETMAGTRIPTFRLIELVEDSGYTAQRISTEVYPDLTVDQIRTALRQHGIDEGETTPYVVSNTFYPW